MQAMRFRKKPVEVNAIQVREIIEASRHHQITNEMSGLPEWVRRVADLRLIAVRADKLFLQVITIQGQPIYAAADEWLLQADDNERDIWPIANEVFEENYEDRPGRDFSNWPPAPSPGYDRIGLIAPTEHRRTLEISTHNFDGDRPDAVAVVLHFLGGQEAAGYGVGEIEQLEHTLKQARGSLGHGQTES